MSDHESRTRRPRTPRSWALWGSVAGAIGLAGIATAIIGVSALGSSAGGHAGSPLTPDPSGTRDAPLLAEEPEGSGHLSEDDAATIIETTVNASLADLESPEAVEHLFSEVAQGSYLAEIEAQWLELNANGWRTEGEQSIVTLEFETPVEADEVASEIRVVACIDASAVRLLDADGDPIGEDLGSGRANHRFTLVNADDSRWRLASHSFPDDPAC